MGAAAVLPRSWSIIGDPPPDCKQKIPNTKEFS
jgi:hypothetical protein